MNYWVERGVQVANSLGYLDRLSEIYPATPTPRQPLPENVRNDIRRLFRAGDGSALLSLLLSLGRGRSRYPFPLEHPYASLLTRKPDLVERNPRMVELLGRLLLSLGEEEIIRGCERPLDLNRQMGPLFQNWLRNHFASQGYPFLGDFEFENYDGIAFLDARNAHIMNFVNRSNTINFQLSLGRDFLAKVGDRYVIGEARFLSTQGGSQTRDLRDTIDFAQKSSSNVITVAVVDGIAWFNKSMLNVIRSVGDNDYVLTALLLHELLNALG